MRVIVTRPRAQAKPLVAALEALGAEVVECPLIEIEWTSDEPIDGAGYDWLIVTSPNGADELARRGVNLPRIAAVGPGTAEALRESGIEAAFVPRESSQEGLLREFPRPAGRVLFAAAEGARRGPVDALQADFVPLYRTRLLTPDPPEARAVYRDPLFDASDAAAAVLANAQERATEAREVEEARIAGLELPAREAEQRVKRAARGAEREELLAQLDELGAWYRDLMAVAVGAESAAIHLDKLPELREDATRERLVGAEHAAEAVRETWRALEELNLAPQLAFEALFIRIGREL
jgi:hypothetical protein